MRDQYREFLLESDSLRVKVTNLGCQIISIEKKEDTWINMILPVGNPEHPELDSAYKGAIIGRVANRIAGGEFYLNDKHYVLTKNNGNNHLHGGVCGFNCKLFRAMELKNGICFKYTSPHMEEGYPGTMDVQVTYLLNGNTFMIYYKAFSDQDTLVNLTNHMYFNLSGGEEDIKNHELQIAADEYLPIDKDCLVTGEVLKTEGTVFDFRKGAVLGNRMKEEETQISLARGFDHAFMLKKGELKLSHKKSGRLVKIKTDLPMVHVYTGNYLSDGAPGPNGKPYKDWFGVALETEKCPDAIHVEKTPSTILRKGSFYTSETSYTFDSI